MKERNFTTTLVRGSCVCDRLMKAALADIPEGDYNGEKVMVRGYKPVVGGPMDGTVEFQLMRVEEPDQWVDVTTIGSTRRTEMNSRTREVRDAGPITFGIPSDQPTAYETRFVRWDDSGRNPADVIREAVQRLNGETEQQAKDRRLREQLDDMARVLADVAAGLMGPIQRVVDAFNASMMPIFVEVEKEWAKTFFNSSAWAGQVVPAADIEEGLRKQIGMPPATDPAVNIEHPLTNISLASTQYGNGKAYRFKPSECTHSHLNEAVKECAGCGLTFKALMELGVDIRDPVDHPCPAVGGACDVDPETKRCTSCHRTQALIDRLEAGMLPMLGDTDWDGERPSAPLHRFDLERAPDGSDMALETAQVDKNHPTFIHPRGRINTTVPLPRVYTLAHHVDDMSGDDVADDVPPSET